MTLFDILNICTENKTYKLRRKSEPDKWYYLIDEKLYERNFIEESYGVQISKELLFAKDWQYEKNEWSNI